MVHKRPRLGRLGALALLLLSPSLLLAACEGAPNMLDPAGPRAARIATMWWVMFGIATAIFVVFVGLFFVAILRSRAARRPADARSPNGVWLVVGLGFVLPILILGFLAVYTNRVLNVLAAPERPPDLTVEVIGYQFWWEVRYPESGVVTANEIHVPAGRVVNLRVTSADVIHSFWTPRIHDKIDMIPGTSKTIWIEADEPGDYRGLCAEFCGVQHSLMQFLIIVHPPEEFDAWLNDRLVGAGLRPAPAPAGPLVSRGQQVFANNLCISCHNIGSPEAPGRPGPDLTHLASRRTLAAGIIANTPENLTAFIRDPQSIKPGNRMPAVPLSDEDLAALVAYLETLE